MTNPSFGMSNPGYKELIEQISYNPALQDSGDLEAATKIISGTAEASGTANADYNTALTLEDPTDTRLVVKNVAARLAVTIDSMTSAELNCRIYVDKQNDAHQFFNIAGGSKWTTTGAKVEGTNINVTSTLGALLADGTAHTSYFFFWVNAGTAIISVANLWESVGWYGTATPTRGLEITHTGLAFLSAPWVTAQGGGTVSAALTLKGGIAPASGAEYETTWTGNMQLLMAGAHTLWVSSDVGTAMAYFRNFYIRFRSEV